MTRLPLCSSAARNAPSETAIPAPRALLLSGRSAHIALLLYADGERRYIIAPRGISAGARLLSGEDAPIKAGNALPLRNIPVGTTVHAIEMKPGKGAQIARSAGASAQFVARERGYATLRLRSCQKRILR